MKYLFLLVSFFSFNTAMATSLSEIKSWGYQLNDYSVEEVARIKNSKNTLWVLDYAKEFAWDDAIGRGLEVTFSKNEMAEMKKNNNIVLAYFCIGEAEEARYYWPSFNREVLLTEADTKSLDYSPEYALAKYFTITESDKKTPLLPGGMTPVLGRSNQQFIDNYPIKFWKESWQQMMVEGVAGHPTLEKSYLDRVIEAGFDGIYLDTVDAYEYYTGKTTDQRAEEMAAFVRRIERKAKRLNPNFKIFLQNGVSGVWHLGGEDAAYEKLYKYVDGFGIEDLFFAGEEEDRPYHYAFSRFSEYDAIKDIRKAVEKARGKKLYFFTVDYILNDPDKKHFEENKERYFKRAAQRDFIPVIADRALKGGLVLYPGK